MELGRKAVVAVVVKKITSSILIFSIFLNINTILAAELPLDELQINLNTYFDNFRVGIFYPDISIRKSLFEKTSINGRYLVDAITSASMKSQFDNVQSWENVRQGIDAITSASPKPGHGGGDDIPDELRHEIGVGITQMVGDISVSFNNLYSIEHDYDSETIAFSASIPMAKQNTILNFGFTRSWDNIYPETRLWTAQKDVTSVNLGFTQILSKDFILQGDAFYSNLSGFLEDAYQVVFIPDYELGVLSAYENRYPDARNRYAIGLRGIHRLGEYSSLELGYRIYDDDWNITSHTIATKYRKMMLDNLLVLEFGLRSYFQSAAFFYKGEYLQVEEFMSADSKLDSQISGEIEAKATINAVKIPYVENEDLDVSVRINYYLRHTETPDWHFKINTLQAYLFTLGFRYRL